MSALFIGFLVVVVSAALFGLALFGRRPVPQPAMAGSGAPRADFTGAETAPSRAPEVHAPGGTASEAGDPPLAGTDDKPTLRAADVRVPLARRVRSVALLALSVFGAAVLVGVVVSILVVGAVLLIA